MSNAPTLQSLLDDTFAHLPMLCREVEDLTQDELQKRAQHFSLLEAWRRQRGRFAPSFEAALRPKLELAFRGGNPLRRTGPASLDALTLVDEGQALQDVAIAHIIATVDEHCKSELHQLGNFFAALRGGSARRDENPVRAALFAQALCDALMDSRLDANGRNEVLRLTAMPLTRALTRLYGGLCEQLKVAELSQLVARYGTASAEQDPRLRRIQEMARGGAPTEPATLDGLARRVDAHNSGPQKFPTLPAVPTPTVSPGEPAGRSMGGTVGAPFLPPVGGGGQDLLTRLYEQILADPRLPTPIKNLLARLQIPVRHLASVDVSLLRRQEHPTWQLLNRVAAHGMGFPDASDERLHEFVQFMDARLQVLSAAPVPTGQMFQDVLTQTEEYIGSQARQRSGRSANALAALEREQMREQWNVVLREQLQDQLEDAPLTGLVHDFMLKGWVEVIVQAMVLYGRDAPEAHVFIDLVDQLLDSLQPCRNETARARLISRIPMLTQRFQQGFESIALPPAHRQAVLRDLQQMHERVVRGESAIPPAPPPAPPEPPTTRQPPPDIVQQVLDERDSQTTGNSHLTRSMIDRGHLRTVPTQLYSHHDSPDARAALAAWTDGLKVGGWYHLFIQSQWLTAQIAWIGESRQYFLFVGQDSEDRQSLTLGAIQRLLANGLITALNEEDSVVQRAVDTLMQDLEP